MREGAEKRSYPEYGADPTRPQHDEVGPAKEREHDGDARNDHPGGAAKCCDVSKVAAQEDHDTKKHVDEDENPDILPDELHWGVEQVGHDGWLDKAHRV
jgi:hypothetical protein